MTKFKMVFEIDMKEEVPQELVDGYKQDMQYNAEILLSEYPNAKITMK